jgi:hypothetical protein
VHSLIFLEPMSELLVRNCQIVNHASKILGATTAVSAHACHARAVWDGRINTSRLGQIAIRRGFGGRGVAKKEGRFVCIIESAVFPLFTIRRLTVNDGFAALLSFVVGRFEPSASIATFSRTMLV